MQEKTALTKLITSMFIESVIEKQVIGDEDTVQRLVELLEDNEVPTAEQIKKTLFSEDLT